MLKNLINQYKDKKILISLYNIPGSSKFIAGYIVGCDNVNVIIAAVTPNGLSDGFLMRKIEEIIRIETDGAYENKIKMLLKLNSYVIPQISFEGELKKALLVYAKENNYIVSIELTDSGYDDCVGFVEEIDDISCYIHSVNSYGDDDGKVICKLSDITQISCNTSDEVVIKQLYMFNKK